MFFGGGRGNWVAMLNWGRRYVQLWLGGDFRTGYVVLAMDVFQVALLSWGDFDFVPAVVNIRWGLTGRDFSKRGGVCGQVSVDTCLAVQLKQFQKR